MLIFVLQSCGGKQEEKKSRALEILSKQTGIPVSIIKILESETGAKAEHLKRHQSIIVDLTKPNATDQQTAEEALLLLPGVFVGVKSTTDYYDLLKGIRTKLKSSGYRVFFCNGREVNDKDGIAIVKSEDEFTPLVYMQTNGINYDLDNAQLIKRLKLLSQRLDLKLLGADFDWCEFLIQKEPEDWNQLAEEIYALCPDIVEQGTQTVSALAREMKETKRLYLWFD